MKRSPDSNPAKGELEASRLAAVSAASDWFGQSLENYVELVELAATTCATEAAAIVLLPEQGLLLTATVGPVPEWLARQPEHRARILDGSLAGGPARLIYLADRSPNSKLPGTNRFAAAAGLRDHDGLTLGAIVVFGHEREFLAGAQARALQTIAKQVTARLELARAHADLTRERDERTRSHARLSYERNLADTVINSAPGIFYLLNTEGRFLRWNQNFERVTGYTHEEVGSTLNALDLFQGRDKQVIAERIGETFATGKSDAEAALVNKEGRSSDYYFTGHLVEIDGQPGLIGMGIDITARKQLESRLREIQRSESIGQLAAGLAHDFNNVLTVIQGQAYRLLSREQLSSNSRSALEQVSMAADRAARLTSQLLVMTRQQVRQTKYLDVNEVLTQSSHMLERLVGEAIAIERQITEGLPAVLADEGMLEQAVMNLVINARDATPAGGRIVVRTDLVEVDGQYVRQHPGSHTGQFVCLSVTDTGTGISDEVLPHIFEAFYTTKEVGKGTGLGLATVYSILKQHHGFVDVTTTVGQGTCFRLFFPPSRRPATSLDAKEYAADASYEGSETVMVVEDETAVAMMLEFVLQEHGYRTLTASDGPEALKLWRTHGKNVDLLITDMVMPHGLSGRDLAHRLWQERSDLPVIYVSGYSAEDIEDDLAKHPSLRYLRKPYRPDALLSLVREAFADPRGERRPT